MDMKKTVLFLAIVFVSVSLFAQKIVVQETSAKFYKDNRNALSTIVYYTDAGSVEKEFKDLLKSYKGKVNTKKGVMFGDDLVISSISDNTVDVYATFKDTKNGEVEVLVGFDLGGAFISSATHPEQFSRASEIIRDFSFNITEQAFAVIVKEEEKNLEKFTKDYEKVVSSKEGLEKDNEDYKKQIESNEKEIEKLSKDIETLSGELKEKQDSFEKLKKEGTKISK
jgi:hypothetical protein